MLFMRSDCGKLTAAFLSTILISGCASDRYFMVEKKDIQSLTTTVNDQSDQVVGLEKRADEGFRELTLQNEKSTETILQAITEQVAKPECPPVPEAPICTIASQNDSGRADRLKGKVIVGEVERFYLADAELAYDARIDSGAETSSLDARNITRFERDGDNWVRFDVPVPDADEFVTLEKEISRRVKIVQSSTEQRERRVVVELQFMIGDHQQEAEFTLTDRGHLSHSVLVGRNILRDVMLIDVGKEFATELPDSSTSEDNGDES